MRGSIFECRAGKALSHAAGRAIWTERMDLMQNADSPSNGATSSQKADGAGDDGLPPADTTRWVSSRKAQVVEAVRRVLVDRRTHLDPSESGAARL